MWAVRRIAPQQGFYRPQAIMGARNRQRPSWIRGRDAIKILNGLYPRSPRTPQSSSMIRGAAKASWKLVQGGQLHCSSPVVGAHSRTCGAPWGLPIHGLPATPAAPFNVGCQAHSAPTGLLSPAGNHGCEESATTKLDSRSRCHQNIERALSQVAPHPSIIFHDQGCCQGLMEVGSNVINLSLTVFFDTASGTRVLGLFSCLSGTCVLDARPLPHRPYAAITARKAPVAKFPGKA